MWQETISTRRQRWNLLHPSENGIQCTRQERRDLLLTQARIPDKNIAILLIEIQAGSNYKLGSFKFISFSLFIDNFSCFKWLSTTVLMKVFIVIDKKKRLRKLSKRKLRPVAIASPNFLNSLAFYCWKESLIILNDLFLRSWWKSLLLSIKGKNREK